MITQEERRGRLGPAGLAEVLALVGAASAADGVHPLSEQALLALRYGGDAATHLLLREEGRLVGYAQLDLSDPVEGPRAELAVAPVARHRGHGRRLVNAALAADPAGRLRLWAHGQHPAAAALARSLGFTRERVLCQLRRSLLEPLPAPRWPPRVGVRTFVVGHDEPAWLAVNARAFAAHPEQGGWTLVDLHVREREPWFDPAGFFLAERDGKLLGFHWTKVHPPGGYGPVPVGEVYVVGVDPAGQGLGLGPALTLVGLHHLRSRGLQTALLYVDADNAVARRMYQRLGFTRFDVDVSYRRETVAVR